MSTSEPPVQLEMDRDREREKDHDRDNDRVDRLEKNSSKQKASSSSSKAKDLSHVPCKFFKVGACTAGSSCPFSHTNIEPGGQKETCAWFVKGTCKFGHKCALAHILPGQSMAMDRKNKKAAQAAAQASNNAGGERSGKESKARGKRDVPGSMGSATASTTRNSLLAGGSTAPTRILNSGATGPTSVGRPPMSMSLKATISPSAPAPPLEDKDFASFAALDEMEGVQFATAPAHGRGQGSRDTTTGTDKIGENDGHPSSSGSESVATTQAERANSKDPLPPSAPRMLPTNPPSGLGPIGSPPNYTMRLSNQMSPPKLNGNAGTFTPGTSPRGHPHINGVNMGLGTSPSQAAILSTSPFSAPGSQSMFMSGSYTNRNTGITASLGSGLAIMGGRKGWNEDSAPASVGGGLGSTIRSQVPSGGHQKQLSALRGEFDIGFEYEEYTGTGIKNVSGKRRIRDDIAVEDEDLEDFLPSSLTELLTPEERSRRMSRSNSSQTTAGQGHAAGIAVGGGKNLQPGTNTALGHRYSRSVPAPSLLGDIKSIWADTALNPLPSSPPTQAMYRGTPPSSLSSRLDSLSLNAAAVPEDAGLGMSVGTVGASSSIGIMSPSNASAAFLPGFHQNYLNSKAKQQQTQQQSGIGLGVGGPFGRGLRGASGSLLSSTAAGYNNSQNSNLLQPTTTPTLSSSISNPSGINTHTHGNVLHTYRTTPSPFDLTQHQPQPTNSARPIPSTNYTDHNNNAESSMLGSHMISPNTRALQTHAPGQSLPQGLAAGYSRIHALPPLSNVVSPGTSGSLSHGTPPGSNNNSQYGEWPGPAKNTLNPVQTSGSGNGSATSNDVVHARVSYSSAASRTGSAIGNSNISSGLSRNINGGRHTSQSSGPLSPLSRPVMSRDDDLFDMDEGLF